MTEKNKEVIRKVNAGFVSGNNEAILSHLTDDVRWHLNGKLSAVGKECKFTGGAIFNAFFFDIYRLEAGKIKEMRSYVVENK